MGASNRFIGLTFLAAATLAAQGGFEGSRFGLIYDAEARSVRPLVGYPGAAYAAASLRQDVDAASVSPDGLYVALRRGERTQLEALASPGVPLLVLPVFRQAIWSDNSRIFALVAEEDGALSVYERKDAQAWAPLEGSGLERYRDETGGLKILALDGARRQLWISRTGLDAGLSVLTLESGTAEAVSLPAGAEALALPWANGTSWWAAAGQHLYRLERGEGSWRAEALPELAPESEGPWLALRQSSATVLIGLRAGLRSSATAAVPARLWRLETNGTPLERMDLEGEGEGLYPVGASSLFLLRQTVRQATPLEAFDAASGRLYFIPVERDPALNSTGGGQ